MRGAGPSPRQSPRTLRPDPGPAMSFFRRKVKGKEQEKTSDVKSIKVETGFHHVSQYGLDLLTL
ncbi:AKAP10 isoform 11 [Pan troglodytes]|uniref:AKAP10 isoform 11 n=2 Tax=Hominidae TaxID=9604 RepID=A0A2J8J7A7_PANTR|nr:AKAP10 isoform 11 [Pan troglodytes]